MGDLGISLYTRKPVMDEIMRRLPATLELTITATFLSIMLGMPLGILTALWRNSWVDHLLRTVSIGALSIVGFWLGIMLQLVLGYLLGLFPLTGRIGLSPPQSVTGFLIVDSILTLNGEALVDSLRHIFLPALAIAFESFATLLRFTRAGVLNVINSDYVSYERAMGMPPFMVTLKYVLRNAVITPVTQIGLIFAQLLGGAVVIEIVFDWPGLGIFLVNSIILSDYKVILGISIWIGLVYIAVNLIIDIAHTFIDPRKVVE
jgi:peptide/nickel transport system permease protein